MGSIRVGTAGWADKTVLDSGWYPPGADNPQRRLEYYASRFPLVEVDSTYYSPPAEQTTALWAARTPPGFVFNVKAFSLLTGHPTQPAKLYKDLRPETDKRNVYPGDLAPQVYEDIWSRFLSALDPLREAGKLGLLLFQFPPWFTIRRDNKQYLLEVAQRCKPLPIAVELRNETWFRGDNATETLEFLRQHELPFVCVDMPQGYRNSVPPLVEATAPTAVMRFHGHSDKWTAKNVLDRFDYDYSEKELSDWVPKLRRLADETDRTYVVMNNCRGDQAQRNGAQLLDLLGEDAVPPPS
ncbi:MAG TPA: DUF72 domain-containing protein [Rugosimonospora sp.]|nr:DUF72 domain-containing protein [Rugosimonospora sp.]